MDFILYAKAGSPSFIAVNSYHYTHFLLHNILDEAILITQENLVVYLLFFDATGTGGG